MKASRVIAWILVVASLSSITTAEDASSPDSPMHYLYLDPQENAPVMELVTARAGDEDGEEPRGDFRLSNKARVVEFYNPFCGACQTYRPTYLKLARDLKDMVGDDIEVYAVSCVAHKEVCDEYSLDDIPLVGLLPGGSSDPAQMRKLKYKEKHPKFIVPFLLPNLDMSNLSETQRALLGADESPDEGEAKDEDEDKDDKDDNDDNEGKEKDDDDTPPAKAAIAEGDDDDKAIDVPVKGGVKKDDDENEKVKSKEEGEESEFLEEVEEANKDWEDMKKGKNAIEIDTLPKLKMLGPGGVKEGAGAQMKVGETSGMDRFRSAIAKQRDDLQNDYLDDGEGKETSGIAEDGGSIAMKAHKPGTLEFAARKKMVQDHIDSLMKQKGLRTAFPVKEKVFSGGAGGASRIDIPFKKVIQKPKALHRVIEKIPFAKRMVALSNEESLILDATLSYVWALKMGVFSDKNPLSDTKKEALQGWLDLSLVSLPPEWGVHELIMELDKEIDVVSESLANLQKVLKRHEVSRKEWSHSCTSDKAQNGFNCGFWKLLHVMTIGIAEHRGGLNLVAGGLVSGQARNFSPAEAAEAMKEFIRNFFPCKPCSEHFVAQYNECSNQRCVRLTDNSLTATNPDWMELSKWLWEVHNDVNVRLLKERSGSRELSVHDEVQVLYPPLHDCTRCFKADGSQNENNIFLYLEKEYWPGSSEIDPNADRLFKFNNVEEERFAYVWVFLILSCGVLYLCRPMFCGVHRRKKKFSQD